MGARQSFGQQKVREHQEEWDRIRQAEERRKRLAAFEAQARDDELKANATEQTVNRARESVVARMLDRQQMRPEQYQAAVEIARVWEAITRRLFATTCRFGQISGGAEGNWPPSLSIAYRERYAPWRDEQGRIVVFRNITACELVFGLACDNHGPRQLAERWNVDHRTLKNAACESLFRYAEMAGWIEHKKPAIPGAVATVIQAA